MPRYSEVQTSDLDRALRIATGEDDASDLQWSEPEYETFDAPECADILDEHGNVLANWGPDGWFDVAGGEHRRIADLGAWLREREAKSKPEPEDGTDLPLHAPKAAE